ncbi:MAG: transglycosylase domain-containing protein, partial [Nitrospinae bacterium]|nr:transglycosylase domain-containing protein [Nitrospinota bacterium]
LELYLNVAEWGEGGIFGIEAAARHYYAKTAAELTPEEASRLASILPSPRRYNPIGESKYVAARANVIYNIMIRRGIVVPEYEDVAPEEDEENNPPDSADLPESELPKTEESLTGEQPEIESPKPELPPIEQPDTKQE